MYTQVFFTFVFLSTLASSMADHVPVAEDYELEAALHAFDDEYCPCFFNMEKFHRKNENRSKCENFRRSMTQNRREYDVMYDYCRYVLLEDSAESVTAKSNMTTYIFTIILLSNIVTLGISILSK